MENATRTVRALAENDADFRRLVRKHQEYESRLQELQSRKFLTEQEKLEEINIKKHKLALKDRMEEMIRLAEG